MDIKEVENYLANSSTKSLCVDRKLSDKYYGFVRDLTIVDKLKVSVEYNTYGYDEGGLTIILLYSTQEELIESLEKYIGAAMDDWDNINCSGFYPDSPGDVDFESSGKVIKTDLSNRCLDIPKGWSDIEVLGNYWLGIYEGKIAL